MKNSEKTPERLAYEKAYREDPINIAKAQLKRKARYAANPEKYIAMQRKYYYGIGDAEADALMAAQGGCCAICRTFIPGGRGRWHLDHCHKTMKVRGFLCQACNMGLGFFRDIPERMEAAADYIRQHATLEV